MFSIYGVSGPVFQGSLKDIDRLLPVSASRAVRAIKASGEDSGTLVNAAITPSAHTAGAGELAIEAYRKMLQVDQERGPLYHADQVMQREVVVVTVNDAVEAAWRTLLAHSVHQAPVLDAGRNLVGMVSERDLLTSFNVEYGRARDVLDKKVGDVMRTPVITAAPVTDIRRIATVMLTQGVDGVPIVNEQAVLVGFISRSDILRTVVADPPLSLWR